MGISIKTVIKVIEKKGNKCYYCGKDAETLDHFIPLAKGGTNIKDNYIPACRKCNTIKRAFDLETFRQIMIRRIFKIPYFNKIQLEYLKSKRFTFKEYDYPFYFETHNLKVPKDGKPTS